MSKSTNFSGTQPSVLAIVGPTASGKSDLAMWVGRKYHGEIICADSRTVYRGLDIGTAKPSQEDRHAVPHFALDIVSPDQHFTVADFQKCANTAIDEIVSREHLPVLVGGSGLYVDAVLYNYAFSDEYAERDPSNIRHLAANVPRERTALRKGVAIIGIDPPRELLRVRIQQRVEAMMERGFIDEVRALYRDFPDSKAALSPGYKAFRAYINNEIDLESAKQAFIRNDYQLAKRQMTWFKRNRDITWFTDGKTAQKYLEGILYT